MYTHLQLRFVFRFIPWRTGFVLHVRPGIADDEDVGRHGGQVQDVRVGRVRRPGGARQRRAGLRADVGAAQVRVPAGPRAEPGHGGVGLFARGHADVQLAQVPGGAGRVLEATDRPAAAVAVGRDRRRYDGGLRRRDDGRRHGRERLWRRRRRRRRGERRPAPVGRQKDAVHVELAAVRGDSHGLPERPAVRAAGRPERPTGPAQRTAVRGSVPVGRRHRPAQGRGHAAAEKVRGAGDRHRPADRVHTADGDGQKIAARRMLVLPTASASVPTVLSCAPPLTYFNVIQRTNPKSFVFSRF